MSMTTTNDGPTGQGYPAKRAAEIVGITYRQLDYWARTGLIEPSMTKAEGSGSRRQYSYKNLLELRAIKSLLDAGIKLESVREAFEYLRQELQADVTAVNLVINGKKSVVVRTGEEIVDLLKGGQGVLNVLPLAGVKQEVDARIVELFPPAASADAAAPSAGASIAAATAQG